MGAASVPFHSAAKSWRCRMSNVQDAQQDETRYGRHEVHDVIARGVVETVDEPVPSLPSCCIPFGSILNSWSHARHCASVMLVGTSVIISRSSRSRWGSRTSDKRDSAAPSASPEPGWSARRSRAASSTGAIAGSMVRWSAFILSTSGAASGLHCTTGIEPTVLGPVVMVKEIHHPQHVVGESHSVGLLPCLRRGGDLMRRRSRRRAECAIPMIRVSADPSGSVECPSTEAVPSVDPAWTESKTRRLLPYIRTTATRVAGDIICHSNGAGDCDRSTSVGAGEAQEERADEWVPGGVSVVSSERVSSRC